MRIDFFRNLEEKLAIRLPINIYCYAINIRNYLRGKCHKIFPVDEAIHLVQDQKNSIYICRRGRHNRYKRGVDEGVIDLAKQYHLNTISLNSGGLLIDCGANVGELGLWAKKNNLKYIAFEPEEIEARCIDLNNFNGEASTFRNALWNKKETLTFYSKPGSADSSLFDMGESNHQLKVEAVRLDQTISLEGYQKPVILKVEAEGAEPEVLEGASGLLDKVDYVTVDCGYERGIEKAHTFVEINSILSTHGFSLVRASFKRVTALYYNERKNPCGQHTS